MRPYPAAKFSPQVRTDKVASVTYIGKAAPGVAASAAEWQIQRLTEGGTTTDLEWADGSADYKFIWDDREALSYS